MVQTDRPQMTV